MATLKRGNYILPHQSQLLGRDLHAEQIQGNPGKRAVGYVLTDEQHAEANHPYRVIVKAPGCAALAWTAFVDVDGFNDWIAAYCLGVEGAVLPGEQFSVVIPECPRFIPLVEDYAKVTQAANGMALIEDENEPMRFAVWLDDDILGAGNTADEALAEARQTITCWQRNRKAAQS